MQPERESNSGSPEREKLTYEKIFYRERKLRGGADLSTDSRCERGNGVRGISNRTSSTDHGLCNKVESVLYRTAQTGCYPWVTGFPTRWSQYCTGELKINRLTGFSNSALNRGADINIVQYLGIAADEPERIARHTKPGFLMPLVEVGWDEAYCRQWCEERDLLSPIYTTVTRGGCWFCHNQTVNQLRELRRDYPDLWAILMRWDSDSPTTFRPNGRTVHDYDKRFQLEDEGKIPVDRRFKWKMLEQTIE